MDVVEKPTLAVLDYILFAVMLLISASIGIYFHFSGGKQKTTDEYLLAGRNMSVWPVAFSIMTSFKSAIGLLGLPAEMYKYGIHLTYMAVGSVIGFFITAYMLLPVYFNVRVSTAYEYLERRYGKLARTLCSIAFVIQMCLMMAVNLYAPALALSAVMNLSLWLSVVSTGVVCTFYCTLGGMKAVLWTDVFQAILMLMCVFTIVIRGCFDDGGITNVFKVSGEGGRLVVSSFSIFDFTSRYTMWNVVLQGIMLAMSATGTNQVQVQRYLTIKNIPRARKSLLISIPITISYYLMNCLIGLIIYAYFADCDPLTSEEKKISSVDQLLPYYVMLKYKDYPGLAGLFLCGVFSAALSSISSAVNSLAAVTMQDIIIPLFSKKGLSQRTAALSAKFITLTYGILCVLLALLVSAFGNLIQASHTLYGMLGGPILGIFTLGMMTTRTNEKGAIIGLLSSIALLAWISFGTAANSTPPKALHMSTEGCQKSNRSNSLTDYMFTYIINVTSPMEGVSKNFTISSDNEDSIESNVFILYRLSYMWFTFFGFALSTVIGYISSIFINILTNEVKVVPQEFLSPAVRWFSKPQPNIEIIENIALRSNNHKRIQRKKHTPLLRGTNSERIEM